MEKGELGVQRFAVGLLCSSLAILVYIPNAEVQMSWAPWRAEPRGSVLEGARPTAASACLVSFTVTVNRA